MKKNKFRMILLFVFFPVTLILVFGSIEYVRGDDWELFGTQKSTGTTYYYNTKKISHPAKGVVRIWCRKILGNKDKESVIDIQRQYDSYTPKWDRLSYEMSLYEMNCNDKTYAIKDITQYTDKGEVLDNLKFDEKLVVIPPGSLTENLFNKVCVPGKKPKK
jgi:hypothetical protein